MYLLELNFCHCWGEKCTLVKTSFSFVNMFSICCADAFKFNALEC